MSTSHPLNTPATLRTILTDPRHRSDGKSPFSPSTYKTPSTKTSMIELRTFLCTYYVDHILTSRKALPDQKTENKEFRHFFNIVTHSEDFFVRARSVIEVLKDKGTDTEVTLGMSKKVKWLYWATTPLRLKVEDRFMVEKMEFERLFGGGAGGEMGLGERLTVKHPDDMPLSSTPALPSVHEERHERTLAFIDTPGQRSKDDDGLAGSGSDEFDVDCTDGGVRLQSYEQESSY